MKTAVDMVKAFLESKDGRNEPCTYAVPNTESCNPPKLMFDDLRTILSAIEDSQREVERLRKPDGEGISGYCDLRGGY